MQNRARRPVAEGLSDAGTRGRGGASQHPLLALQRAAGNRAVCTVVQREDRQTSGTVDVQSQERDVGSWTYDIHGRYNWRITPDALEIEVGFHWTPDAGVSAPTATWFQYIRDVWNHFSAVKSDDPTQKRSIQFVPVVSDSGHVIQVSSGTGRANAGHYFVADDRATTSIPHEFGHLLGLEDEYERSAADFQRVTGQAPTGDASQHEAAARLATELHDAVFNPEHWYEFHTTAVERRMGAVNRVLGAHNIGGYNWGATPLTRQTAIEYKSAYSRDFTDDLASGIDRDDDVGNFRDWRESVAGAFQFTSTSIMGDMTDHTHPVAPRHVRGFLAHIRTALGGVWHTEQDH